MANKNSFNDAKQSMMEFQRFAAPAVQIALVAAQSISHTQQQVSHPDLQQFAATHNIPLYLIDASTGRGVQALVQQEAQRYLESQNQQRQRQNAHHNGNRATLFANDHHHQPTPENNGFLSRLLPKK